MGSSRNRPAPGPPGGDRRHGPDHRRRRPRRRRPAGPDPTPHYRGGGPGNAAVRFAARWKDSRRGGGAVNRVDCQRSSRTYQFSTPVGALGSGTGLLVWILTEMKMMAVGASCESRPEQLCVALVASASAPSVTKWSQRFDREGLDGLKDKPGRGAKPTIPLATVRRVVEEAGKAPPGRQRWSTRSLAREVGISAHSVARIWQSQGLKPHRLRTFKVSRDKKFEEKFWDVVGLYLDPPERSLVLCCDEKTPEEVEHGIRRKWNSDSGGSGTANPGSGTRNPEEVEHRFRRKWNSGSGGRERSSVA